MATELTTTSENTKKHLTIFEKSEFDSFLKDMPGSTDIASLSLFTTEQPRKITKQEILDKTARFYSILNPEQLIYLQMLTNGNADSTQKSYTYMLYPSSIFPGKLSLCCRGANSNKEETFTLEFLDDGKVGVWDNFFNISYKTANLSLTIDTILSRNNLKSSLTYFIHPEILKEKNVFTMPWDIFLDNFHPKPKHQDIVIPGLNELKDELQKLQSELNFELNALPSLFIKLLEDKRLPENYDKMPLLILIRDAFSKEKVDPYFYTIGIKAIIYSIMDADNIEEQKKSLDILFEKLKTCPKTTFNQLSELFGKLAHNFLPKKPELREYIQRKSTDSLPPFIAEFFKSSLKMRSSTATSLTKLSSIISNIPDQLLLSLLDSATHIYLGKNSIQLAFSHKEELNKFLKECMTNKNISAVTHWENAEPPLQILSIHCNPSVISSVKNTITDNSARLLPLPFDISQCKLLQEYKKQDNNEIKNTFY